MTTFEFDDADVEIMIIVLSSLLIHPTNMGDEKW